VNFATIILCVASQRVFIVFVDISLSTQSGNFWLHPHTVISSFLNVAGNG
jgi:hypothetical protein